MGTNTYSKDETRIRERMAALLAEARSTGEDVADKLSAEAPVAVPPPDATIKPRTRGPQKAPTKQAVSIRLDADLVEELRNSGKGWQTRVNSMLREVLSKAP